jgi:hypothetical protein
LLHKGKDVPEGELFVTRRRMKFVVFKGVDVGEAFAAAGRDAPQAFAPFHGFARRKLDHDGKKAFVVSDGGDIVDGIDDPFAIEKTQGQFLRELVEA